MFDESTGTVHGFLTLIVNEYTIKEFAKMLKDKDKSEFYLLKEDGSIYDCSSIVEEHEIQDKFNYDVLPDKVLVIDEYGGDFLVVAEIDGTSFIDVFDGLIPKNVNVRSLLQLHGSSDRVPDESHLICKIEYGRYWTDCGYEYDSEIECVGYLDAERRSHFFKEMNHGAVQS